ncbi:hypothetical protein XM38_037040 [Halomicronema hongdechloris C2206]|uniref:Uncharacterized protein n=1 Tax=Halomicronema hongdechloris C2206 TaxID=1641165 RepID=A0A1Z3HR37_9CYAN|nr:hypothetical protein [Halomicronema hongdechloris]ASC72745.1 hypothetical protein XM38_037040 [Halomicronema hongdechloris C2206]
MRLALIQRWQWGLHWLMAQPRHHLILQLTVLLVALHEINQFHWSRLPERLLAVAMLGRPAWLQSRWAWISLSALLVVNNTVYWFRLVNHEYLITYWVLACTLAIFAPKPRQVLAWNGRWLIGLCFAFAIAWKLIAGEYLDGSSFLHLTFLLDHRLAMGAVLLGGVPVETLTANRELFSLMQTTGYTDPIALTSNPLMSSVSLVLSYWTLSIEGLVALAFLSPWPARLWRQRDWWLILFIVTTYAVIPVFAFAAILRC